MLKRVKTEWWQLACPCNKCQQILNTCDSVSASKEYTEEPIICNGYINLTSACKHARHTVTELGQNFRGNTEQTHTIENETLITLIVETTRQWTAGEGNISMKTTENVYSNEEKVERPCTMRRSLDQEQQTTRGTRPRPTSWEQQKTRDN